MTAPEFNSSSGGLGETQKTGEIKLNPNERTILLFFHGQPDEYCHSFDTISLDTKLDRRVVRLACRSLRRKGLTEFVSGLYNEDGGFAGSGYRASTAGRSILSPAKGTEP